MRLPSYDHLLLNRATHRSCLQKVGSMGQVLFLLFLILALVPFCAYGQIGNLGWAEGAEPLKRVINYYESARFQLLFEPSAGLVLQDETKLVNGIEAGEYTDKSFILDAGLGASYRLFLSHGTGPRIELGIHGSVSANTEEIDFDHIRLIGAIAPEIGIKLATKGKSLQRLFFSFGPGLSVFNDSFGFDNETFRLLWVIRAGMEIGSINSPFSGILGFKMIKRSEYEFERFRSYSNGDVVTFRINESNVMLMLGIRYRIA